MRTMIFPVIIITRNKGGKVMNTVCLAGRLTRDIEVKEYGKAKEKSKIGTLTIAVRDGLDENGKPRTQFIRCVAWNKTCDVLEQFTEKGQWISIVGRIKNGSYEDKDGIVRYTTDVYITDFDLTGKPVDRDDEDEEEKPARSNKKYHR